jgi:hypothetical protein
MADVPFYPPNNPYRSVARSRRTDLSLLPRFVYHCQSVRSLVLFQMVAHATLDIWIKRRGFYSGSGIYKGSARMSSSYESHRRHPNRLVMRNRRRARRIGKDRRVSLGEVVVEALAMEVETEHAHTVR